MPLYIDNITVESDAIIKNLVLPSTPVATTLNGTLTLNNTDASNIYLTGTATGYSVVMPDATTIPQGHIYTIYNTSSQNVIIKTADGATLFILSQTSIGQLYLLDNGTIAGLWSAWQVFNDPNVASGILNYKVTATAGFNSTSATSDPVTGFTVTPVAGRYAVWVNAQWQNTNASATLGLYVSVAGIDQSDSIRTCVVGSANRPFPISTMTTVLVDGSQTVAGEISTSAGTLTISNRTLLLIRLGAT